MNNFKNKHRSTLYNYMNNFKNKHRSSLTVPTQLFLVARILNARLLIATSAINFLSLHFYNRIVLYCVHYLIISVVKLLQSTMCTVDYITVDETPCYIHQSVNQSINQSINQLINHTTIQLIDQSLVYVCSCVVVCLCVCMHPRVFKRWTVCVCACACV